MMLVRYFIWHYRQAIKGILLIWRNFLVFWWHFFSIGLLSRTLLSPWKRTVELKTSPGFDFKEFFSRFFWNLFSRLIGFFVRGIFVLAGFLAEIFTLIFGIIFFIFWITLPLWLIYFVIKGWWLLILVIVFCLLVLFFESFIKENPRFIFPQLKKIENLSNILGYSCAKALSQTLKASSNKQFEVLLKKLLETEELKKVFYRLGQDRRELRRQISEQPIELDKVLAEAFAVAKSKKHKKIKAGDIFCVLAKNQSFLDRYFFERNIGLDDIFNVVFWVQSEKNFLSQKHRFWELENLLRVPGVGKRWSFGYTVNLDKYSHDLFGQGLRLGAFAHLKELKALEQCLARAGENNALIVGQPGVGRKNLVYALADLVAAGHVFPALEYKRVVELNLSLLFSGVKDAGQLRQRVLTVFGEAIKAGNIILVIDEFQNIIEARSFQSNLVEIILPFLGSARLQVVGLIDYENFHNFIGPNGQLLKFFEKIEVKEPSAAETLLILEESTATLEKQEKTCISHQALKEIVKKADLYIQDTPFPEKALDVLDELVVYVKANTKDKVATPEHVNHLISLKTGIPVGRIGDKEKAGLINLEDSIHKKIINQEEAVGAVSDALRRSRTGLAAKKRPIGTFLFFGPTGVGKTSLARVLAEIFFGSEKRMIRLDMAEFKEDSSVQTLIGSFEPRKPGILTSAIREKPYTLVLLDEIEKAGKSILDLFLEAFDEGVMRDAFGKTVSFRNTIIIATSNAGAQMIRDFVREGRDLASSKEEILDHLQSEGIFKPEFLNRFDAVVLFRPLSKENLLSVAQIELEQLNSRLSEEHDMSLAISSELKEKIVELGYNPEYGARPMRRVIQDRLEALIAKKILYGEFRRGEQIIIRPEDI